MELLQTLAANTAAPFIMCSKLASVPLAEYSKLVSIFLAKSQVIGPKSESEPFGHIVNVSVLAAVSLSAALPRCFRGQIQREEQEPWTSAYQHGQSCVEHDDPYGLQGPQKASTVKQTRSVTI